MPLSREQILGIKPKRKLVDVPQWGDSVLIQSISFDAAQDINAGETKTFINWIIASAINEDGSPLFSPEDAPSLRRLDVAGLIHLGEEIVEFNALKKDAAVEEEKNSVPGLNGGSSSA